MVWIRGTTAWGSDPWRSLLGETQGCEVGRESSLGQCRVTHFLKMVWKEVTGDMEGCNGCGVFHQGASVFFSMEWEVCTVFWEWWDQAYKSLGWMGMVSTAGHRGRLPIRTKIELASWACSTMVLYLICILSRELRFRNFCSLPLTTVTSHREGYISSRNYDKVEVIFEFVSSWLYHWPQTHYI